MFDLRPPSLIKSIVQRSLLKRWETLGGPNCCAPAEALVADEDLRSFLPDCVIYGAPNSAGQNFSLLYQGTNTVTVYGGKLASTALSQHVAPAYRERLLASYEAVVRTCRPFFSIRMTQDANRTPVAVETLRLPFLARRGQPVTHILTHFHLISIEGRFTAAGLHQDHGACHYSAEALIAPSQHRGPGAERVRMAR